MVIKSIIIIILNYLNIKMIIRIKIACLIVLIIIEIAEYVYQSSMVVDKEITFMACIAKVIKTINK